MIRHLLLVPLLVLCVPALDAQTAAQTAIALQPPVAKKVHVERAIGGAILVDDYGWLRERNSPEVHQYLEAENAYAEAATASEKPLADALYKETLAHIKQTDESVPYRRNGYWYYRRTLEGKQYPLVCRRKGSLDAPEEVMLDVNRMAEGEKFLGLGQVEVSDDNTLLAYTTDNVGFRQYQMHVKNLTTGAILPDTAARVTSLAWAADSRTLIYATEDATTKRSDMIHRHTLAAGTNPASPDPLLFEEKDERFDVEVERSRDRKYILLGSSSHITSEWSFLPAQTPTAAPTVIEPRHENVRYSVDEGNGMFYLLVNDTDPSNRLVSAPVASPGKAHWTELVAARHDVPLQEVEVFDRFYVLGSRVKGLDTLTVIDLKTRKPSAIDFPEPAYEASGSINAEFVTDTFRYGYQSPVTPSSTFAYNVGEHRSTLLKQQQVPGYDKSLYTVKRLLLPAADGTAIPTTVLYRTASYKPSANPLYVYAYGSYGVTMPDTFSVARLPLLDRGVIVAVAHIRGGGELGEAWHDAGKMMTKRNTFTDFIDSTRNLLQAGYGRPGQVGIEGASAGGLLMGAVTNMAPAGLFKVVLCEVPFVDVMNTMLDASLPLTVSEYEEWGNPNQKAAFDYMRTYSPYDNLAARPYPAILVQTSFDDSQVMYWEPAKYVARLRALKTDREPLVFFINMHGGHGGSSGRFDRIRESDRRYAFLLTELGIRN